MEVYTDGSCIGNQTEGRFAGAGVWFGENDKRNSSILLIRDKSTNQRAELVAIKYALLFCRNVQSLIIKTDSQYSISCMTTWAEMWVDNHWMTSQGKEVVHSDIIKECISLLHFRKQRGYTTSFVHVRGHSGDRGNNGADELARNAALALKKQYLKMD